MKKKEFLGELNKRFKYIGEITQDSYGFINLKRYKVEVGIVENYENKFQVYKQLYHDTISFWVEGEGRSNERILDVECEGSYLGFSNEIFLLLKGSGVYCERQCERNEEATRNR